MGDSLFPILRIKPRINRFREQPYSTTWLLKSTPKRCVVVLGLCDGFRIVFDEIRQKLRTIDFVGEHILAALLEGGATFIGIHRNQLLHNLIHRFRTGWLFPKCIIGA